MRMWNATNLVQDLNSCRRVHFLRRKPLHHGHLGLIYGTFESIRLDQTSPVEHELDACNWHLQEHLYVASNFCYVYSDAQFSLRHPATSFLGNIFWRLSCLSPTTTRITHLWVTTSFLRLNSEHDFCLVYGDAYSAQTFSIALTVTTHILLRHLAAINSFSAQ